MYIENEQELEKLVKGYNDINNEIAKLESNEAIIEYQKNLKEALDDFKEYFNSEEGQLEIHENNNFEPGYYNGSFETRETLLSEYYLNKQVEIKEDIYNALDDKTKTDYEQWKSLKEKQFEYEMLFPDTPEEVGLSNEVYDNYKEEFEK
ncbi:hypothetical protein [Staphylococcus aureus]|uniref:hypothetical protein n=1 Tax=Staphylococcus aureus TaxID=1280 RepID=UPI000E02457C|nr:hypothetical protein [Staphylococcus aureus]MCW0257224.1 hypothetical protein [Staphylococcus aureus]SUL87515.1 Uncharacterised protein [Staphylococcus aureus]